MGRVDPCGRTPTPRWWRRRRRTRHALLYDRYFPRVYGYVRRQLGERSACEDVASQVFITALARIHSFRGEGTFSAWLFRIAQHAVKDTYRARIAQPAVDEELEALPDHEPTPEERVLAGERAAFARGLVGTLRLEQRRLLRLRFGLGLSAVEIGQLLGKSAVAVRVSLHRTMQDLRGRVPNDP